MTFNEDKKIEVVNVVKENINFYEVKVFIKNVHKVAFRETISVVLSFENEINV